MALLHRTVCGLYSGDHGTRDAILKVCFNGVIHLYILQGGDDFPILQGERVSAPEHIQGGDHLHKLLPVFHKMALMQQKLLQ